MKENSSSDSNTQLLVANWGITYEADAFEGNQM